MLKIRIIKPTDANYEKIKLSFWERTDPRPYQVALMIEKWKTMSRDQRAIMRDASQRNGINNRRYFIHKDAFAYWSDESAYWLGYLFADGNLYGTKIVSAVSINRELLDGLSKFIIESGGDAIYQQKGTIKYQWSVCDLDLFQRLLVLGLTPRKSLTMLWPDVPNKHIRHFIRGYFDGDGGVWIDSTTFRLKVSWGSGSKAFLESLQQILASYDISAKLYSYENRKGRIIHFLNVASYRGQLLLAKFLYTGAGFYLVRKRSVFESYFALKANQDFTSQQAANFLDISRISLIRLLDSGLIPFYKLKTHRRIRQEDLNVYQRIMELKL